MTEAHARRKVRRKADFSLDGLGWRDRVLRRLRLRRVRDREAVVEI